VISTRMDFTCHSVDRTLGTISWSDEMVLPSDSTWGQVHAHSSSPNTRRQGDRD